MKRYRALRFLSINSAIPSIINHQSNNLPEELAGDFNNRWKDFCSASKSLNITLSYDTEIFAALKQVFTFSDFVARTCIHHPDILDNLIKSGDLQKRYIPGGYNNKLKKLLTSGSRHTAPDIQHIHHSTTRPLDYLTMSEL